MWRSNGKYIFCMVVFALLVEVVFSTSNTLPRYRQEFGSYLNTLHLHKGAEIGVEYGKFAMSTLVDWETCTEYHLVDPWGLQYGPDPRHAKTVEKDDEIYQKTLFRLAPWQNILKVHRMTSAQAAAQVADNSLDYVYIDARHDYCSVKLDLELWWPKIRVGGIIAGHDYMTNLEVNRIFGYYYLCPDGSSHDEGVKGAVDEFARLHNKEIHTTQWDTPLISFMIHKFTE